MKTCVGVLGVGKTGSEVRRLLSANPNLEIIAFDRKHPLTQSAWTTLDAAVCFWPGDAFVDHLDIFLTNPKPMVIGSTGYQLTPAQQQAIDKLPCPWIMSFNFSLGMSLAKISLTNMGKWLVGSGLEAEHSIRETHHTQKKDAPSGTALLWKRWIESTGAPQVNDIQSFRVADACGRHEYELRLAQETMTFVHDAKSRAVFAEGAVWALNKLLKDEVKTPGRVEFFDLVERFVNSTAKR